MKKTKVFAAYLPQYHRIKENDEFWGAGFTDWVGVKKSVPQFDGHNQPRRPLDDNYYDLSDWKVLEWQAKLAKEHGVDGFCIYHYWFKDAHKVLETPAENLLSHPEIEIGYFFSWDNNSWIRSWSNIAGNAWAPNFEKDKSGSVSPMLLECAYGGKNDWKEHFEYLLPFFKDERYLRIDDKPVFQFFADREPQVLKEMGQYWNELAQENGLKGLFFMCQKAPFIDKHVFNSEFIYQPIGIWNKQRAIKRRMWKLLGISGKKQGLTKINYDKAWAKIIRQVKSHAKESVYFSGIVRYDDSPRRGKSANVFVGDTPEKFEKWFATFYRLNCMYDREFLLLTAWNEWGEGAYLEPDADTKYSYLEALKHAVAAEC